MLFGLNLSIKSTIFMPLKYPVLLSIEYTIVASELDLFLMYSKVLNTQVVSLLVYVLILLGLVLFKKLTQS
jgi:hypothetical protein